jgi:hypothetical protein
MSGREVRLDAPAATRAGQDLQQVGQDIAGVRSSLGARIAAAAAARPWGSDDIGAQFGKNYDPPHQSALDAWTTIATYVESLGERAVQAAKELTDADTASGARVQKAYH